MKGIFEGAKFGDRFVTRDGQMAIYVAKHEECNYYGGTNISHTYALENRCTVHWCKDNGINLSFIEDFDIVGRWQESIDDDEKSCDKIKRNCINCVWPTRFDSMGTCFLRCEENPNVCDHPFCVELEEAASMCCEQFSSTEVCTHCRYMGVNQCNNSKQATFKGDMVVLRHCNYNDKACEFFEMEKQ